MNNYIIYARKSTESDDRQILSIESQIKELQAYAVKNNLHVIEILEESKSAKSPGRPVFNILMQKFHEERVSGILCWKLDRLARNPVDGGTVLWALEQGKISEIRTPERVFTNRTDDQFMMNLDFGIAKKYVNDLSYNVKRGIKAKLEKGWLPRCAPTGYLNDKIDKTIVLDPDTYDVVREMFEKYSTGNYSLDQLQQFAEERLLTKKCKKVKWKSTIARILANPFYYGVIRYNDDYFKGAHKPIISLSLFDKVQKVLQSRGHVHEKRQKHVFPYTGLILCSSCGCSITAEERINRYGTAYTYYHCTHKKKKCTQKKYVRDYILEEQIEDMVASVTLGKEEQEICLDILYSMHAQEDKKEVSFVKEEKKTQKEFEQQLKNLIDMKLSNRIDDEYYDEKYGYLRKRIADSKTKVSGLRKVRTSWFSLCEKFFLCSTKLLDFIRCPDYGIKREIVRFVGSNFVLKDGKLLYELKKPFSFLVKSRGSCVWSG